MLLRQAQTNPDILLLRQAQTNPDILLLRQAQTNPDILLLRQVHTSTVVLFLEQRILPHTLPFPKQGPTNPAIPLFLYISASLFASFLSLTFSDDLNQFRITSASESTENVTTPSGGNLTFVDLLTDRCILSAQVCWTHQQHIYEKCFAKHLRNFFIATCISFRGKAHAVTSSTTDTNNSTQRVLDSNRIAILLHVSASPNNHQT
jgi:hypothetical protein